MRQFLLSAFFVAAFSSFLFGEMFGDYEYSVTNGEVKIVKYNGQETIVSIPNEINGQPVKTIGSVSFIGNSVIEKVTMPNTVTKIEAQAFQWCTSLNEIILSANLTHLGTPETGGAVFYSCSSLTQITIPDTVVFIHGSMFEGTQIQEISIPAGVAFLGPWAFNGITSLKKVTFKGPLPAELGQSIFGGNSPDLSLYFYAGLNGWSNASGIWPGINLIDVGYDGDWLYTVENNEATIRGYTGVGGELTIPNQIQLIGSQNTLPVKTVGNGVTPIFGMENITVTKVTIPNGVTEIAYGAFMGCSSLVTISLPASITVIKPYAFNRTGIYAVTIPNGLTKVEKDSFSQCPNLTSVSIPSSITSIADAAFGGCNSLTSITVPSSVTSLGLISFGYCPALTRVEFLGNPPTYLSNLFEGSPVVTIYFLSSVSGWGDTYAGRPTDFLDRFRLSIENDISKGELLQPVNYSSSNRSYLAGANLEISVAAKPGYLFAGWQGSLTSSSDTVNIIMDSSKNVTASYAQDNQDSDSDGLTNFQESITYGTNPNQKDTNSDGIEDGQAVTLGYNPTFNFSALLGYLQSHPPTGLYTTLQYTGNYAAGQTAGRAEVTSFPATYNLYTTDQIQNMAIGDLVLTRDSDGKFTLEYNIEQSEDLQNWSVYSSNTQVVRLPPNKAFVRIKAKQ